MILTINNPIGYTNDISAKKDLNPQNERNTPAPKIPAAKGCLDLV